MLEKAHLALGGSSSQAIGELVDAGFLTYAPLFDKKKTGGIYRLIDEYSLFYLTWIEETSPSSLDPEYWIKKQNTPKWKAWSGCAFEAICLKHTYKIKQALGISGISNMESGWHYLPKKFAAQTGAQIDLVIDRADRCINLCEIKYSDVEFALDKSYAEKLLSKKKVFKEQIQTKNPLFTTLITTYGAKKNSYFLSTIDQQLTLDDLF